MKILVVEDESEVVRILRRWLTAEGHQIVTAHSAVDAVQILSGERFDLALIDWELGTILTGIDVGKHARMRDPTIAMLMISGHDPLEMQPRAENVLQPFLAVIGKPLDRDLLISHVRAVARRLDDTKP
jgi:two-component system, NtrC family, nitrogen regulation response regulator NtrX